MNLEIKGTYNNFVLRPLKLYIYIFKINYVNISKSSYFNLKKKQSYIFYQLIFSINTLSLKCTLKI